MGSNRFAGTVLSCLLLQCLGILPVAALSSADAVYAIKKRQFLPPGTALNVKVDKDQVLVSTFRHSNAEAKDCKIDAVLITKAILDAAPDDVARVTTYFYGKDLTSYQEVSVSAGDIKAFASGQMTNEQLLASLQVRLVNTGQESETEKMSKQLESDTITHPSDYKIAQDKADSLTVWTNLAPWVSDDDARLEAFRIACTIAQVNSAIQTVRVILTDPAMTADSREFDFLTERLGPMRQAIQNAVGSVSLVKRPVNVDLQTLSTVKGAEQESRDALLAELREMEKKGIGIAPFTKVFLKIEEMVKREADPKGIAESVARLKANMDDQMKAYTSAKEKKITKVPDKTPPPPANTGHAKIKSRWEIGRIPIIDAEILKDPDGYVSKFESSMRPTPQEMVKVLDRVVALLTNNNRASEAGKFQLRADQIRSTIKK